MCEPKDDLNIDFDFLAQDIAATIKKESKRYNLSMSQILKALETARDRIMDESVEFVFKRGLEFGKD